ncbi:MULTISPECIES: hypothetical protein [Comamonas]|uniref:Uncharacterized protein n=1 Tax=Comamonas sediminis TaxID=1783360 RepID=A0ABV4AX40_9BURK|nr:MULTISPECIES: hypothetical protein [unclassified Comamonas]
MRHLHPMFLALVGAQAQKPVPTTPKKPRPGGGGPPADGDPSQ